MITLPTALNEVTAGQKTRPAVDEWWSKIRLFDEMSIHSDSQKATPSVVPPPAIQPLVGLRSAMEVTVWP